MQLHRETPSSGQIRWLCRIFKPVISWIAGVVVVNGNMVVARSSMSTVWGLVPSVSADDCVSVSESSTIIEAEVAGIVFVKFGSVQASFKNSFDQKNREIIFFRIFFFKNKLFL